MSHKTLLKYAGNKRSIMHLITPHFGDMSKVKRYFEPFCGALGSSLNAHIPKNVEIFLSDSNWEIINFYEQVADNAQIVENLANSWEYGKNVYYEVRNWDRDPDWRIKRNPIEIAARTIFLNRNCFNGLFRINRHGHFNTPWGHPTRKVKISIAENDFILNFLKRVDLKCADWKISVQNTSAGDALYCDPPYVDVKNPHQEFGGYVGAFGWDAQVSLRDQLLEASRRGVRVVTTNSWCPDTEALYKNFNVTTIEAPRSLSSKGASRGSVKELLAWL